MYFINKSKIKEELRLLEQLIKELQWIQAKKETNEEQFLKERAIQRIGQLMIELIVDIGNQLIDGFILRDPGSYHDIIDILTDEQVITREDCTAFKRLIDWRKPLVVDFLNLDTESLSDTILSVIPQLQLFEQNVLQFINKELQFYYEP